MNQEIYFQQQTRQQLQQHQQLQQQQAPSSSSSPYQQSTSVIYQPPSSSSSSSAERCLATGHRTNPHSYYAATNGGTVGAARGGICAGGEAGKSGTGAVSRQEAVATGRGEGAGGGVYDVSSRLDSVRSAATLESCAVEQQNGNNLGYMCNNNNINNNENLGTSYPKHQQSLQSAFGNHVVQQQQQRQQEDLDYLHQLQQDPQQQRVFQQEQQPHWVQFGRYPTQSSDVSWMANATDRTPLPSSQFPDSPPDSGSEPYSPPNDNRSVTTRRHSADISLAAASSHASVHPNEMAVPVSPFMNSQHYISPHLRQDHPNPHHGSPARAHSLVQAAHCQAGQQGLSCSTTTPSAAHLHHHQQQHQQHLQQHIALHRSAVGFNMTKNPLQFDTSYGRTIISDDDSLRMSQQSPPGVMSLGQLQQRISPQYGNSNLSNPAQKKRKHSDSPPGTLTPGGFNPPLRFGNILPIKPEPCPPPHDLGYGIAGDCVSDDESYCYDFPGESGMFLDGAYQVIKWTPHLPTKWVTLFDESCKELPTITYRVDADKGFNFAQSDDAFVCQKKNHFQITVHFGVVTSPKFLQLPEGGTLIPIDSFYLHFYGIKMESPTQTIKIEQSQSDRSKKQFHAVKIDSLHDLVNKITVGRLHFSETTTNNMRKKGKPNPDQRYFQLVVALQAQCGGDSHMVAAHASERIIVRASNPGQFESDVEVTWNKGKTPESIYHAGRVGINTDSPEEALAIHGNLKVTGHIVCPSDIRAKTEIRELDTREQLENISKLKVYKYSFREEFAEYAGLSGDERTETGILAQEVSQILPDAVRDTGDVILPSGERIDNFLVVNKDRIFIENVGAVKELCKVTDKLENRITEMEYINTKLAKINGKKTCGGSIISSSSISASICSSFSRGAESRSSESSIAAADKAQTRRHHHHHRHRRRAEDSSSAAVAVDRSKMCTNRGIQLTVIVLVVVMFVCLMSMTVLYLVDRKYPQESASLLMMNGATPPAGHGTTKDFPRPLVPPHCLVVPQDCPTICSCGPKPTTPLPSPPPDDWIHPRDPASSTRSPNEIPDDIFPPPSSTTTVQSTNVNETTTRDASRIDNDTKYRNKTKASYIRGDSAADNSVIEVGKRSKRDAIDMKSPVTRIYFKQLNESVSHSYCTSSECMDDYGGNYSYLIPISPVFPRLFITLKFIMISAEMDPSLTVTLCKETSELSCSSTVSYDFKASQINSLEWDLPAGYFVRSYFKFRIAQMSVGVCERPDSEAGVSFVEYSLSFYRVCAY